MHRGAAIKDSDSIIVVEGRSDVLNLLKYGIKNTIAVQGTNIPKTVQKLSKERTVTVFLDGDRGGDLILREMLQVAEVDFVARAPPGTEVEELTYKQIVKALRYKTPVEQYLSMKGMSEELKELTEKTRSEEPKHQRPAPKEKEREIKEIKVAKVEKKQQQPEVVEQKKENGFKEEEDPGKVSLDNPKSIEKRAEFLLQEKTTEIYSDGGEVVASFPVADAIDKLAEVANGNTIITGGVISQRLVDVAYKIGIKNIYGVKLGHITKKPTEVRVVAWDHHT